VILQTSIHNEPKKQGFSLCDDMSPGRDPICRGNTAVAVHPGLINTTLARGWLIGSAVAMPPFLRPLLAPLVSEPTTLLPYSVTLESLGPCCAIVHHLSSSDANYCITA